MINPSNMYALNASQCVKNVQMKRIAQSAKKILDYKIKNVFAIILMK